jgi:hypothetical protein
VRLASKFDLCASKEYAAMFRISMLTVCVVLSVSAGGLLADAESDFQMLFGDDYKRVVASRNGLAAATLATQMMQTVGAVKDRPDLDMLILTRVADLGAKDPSGFATAVAAIKQLLKTAPDNSPRWIEKLSAIYKRQYILARGAERVEVGQQQLDDFISIADAQSSAQQGANALLTYRKALSIAIITKSPRRQEILDKIRSANAQALQQREIERLTRTLATDPDNSKIRTAVVLLNLLELDSPEQAATFLNDDLDETLRTYVLMAAKNIDDLPAQACLELGRWYWEKFPSARTSRSKATVLKRTGAYLRRFTSRDTEGGTNKLRAMLILKDVDAQSVKLASKGQALPTKPGIIADFESPRMTGWTMTGTAFGKGPCTGRPTPSYPASGFAGKGMISSYHQGDSSTGTLTSPKFVIRGKSITFLIGGGQWGGRSPARVGMDLIVNGKAVRTVTGRTSNTLHLAGWDVADLVGKTAQLHMVDTSTGGWGHILVDHIVQHPGKLETVIKPPADPKATRKKKTSKGRRRA